MTKLFGRNDSGLSFPRRRESSNCLKNVWIPTFVGMTERERIGGNKNGKEKK
ncbi:MAG: hypothetical protein ABII25_03810 [bacterium]